MNDYIFLMHDDAPEAGDGGNGWELYLARLRKSGLFAGGSAIGTGVCVTKSGPAAEITAHLSGYIRVQANSIEDARKLLDGNPVFEAGAPLRSGNCRGPGKRSNFRSNGRAASATPLARTVQPAVHQNVKTINDIFRFWGNGSLPLGPH